MVMQGFLTMILHERHEVSSASSRSTIQSPLSHVPRLVAEHSQVRHILQVEWQRKQTLSNADILYFHCTKQYNGHRWKLLKISRRRYMHFGGNAHGFIHQTALFSVQIQHLRISQGPQFLSQFLLPCRYLRCSWNTSLCRGKGGSLMCYGWLFRVSAQSSAALQQNCLLPYGAV